MAATAAHRMTDNGGLVLTNALMDWFWDHYAESTSERATPKPRPVARLADLSNLAAGR